MAPNYLIGGLVVMAVGLIGWDSVPSSWTCFGVWTEMRTIAW